MRCACRSSLLPILLVDYVLHPGDNFAVQIFLNGDVRHSGCGRRAVPVLLAGRKPHHIARMQLFDWSAFTLRPSATRSHDQRLPEWMRVPCRASAGLKSDVRALNTRRFWGLKQWINSYRASEPIRWSLRGRL